MILSSLVHTDFQPYLLPNTDAWALPGDKALELLVYLEQQGVRQIYCVPPVKVENEGNAFSFLKDAFQYLQQQYSGNISLRLSARYRLDEGFPALLEKGDLLAIGGGKELLVDVSPLQQPVGLYPCPDATGTFALLGNGRLSALAGIGMQADAESIFLVRL